jgi:hypothetical protein
MPITNAPLKFYIGLIFAIWFALTSCFWTYFGALFISYPFGIVSYILWRQLKTENKKYKSIPIILSIGLVLSVIVLMYYIIWE